MSEEKTALSIPEITKEIDLTLADKETVGTLISTTFEGFDESLLRQAIMKARMMEFDLRDILIGNIYAVKYNGKDGKGPTVQIITSVGHIRKVGARSGVVGKDEPVFERDAADNILACSVTIKKMTGTYVGDFTAKVYWGEYSTGKNLWLSKPHTMISKVAEAHAIRMACPEEAKNMYIAEEFEQKYNEAKPANVEVSDEQIEQAQADMSSAKTMDELTKTFLALPLELRNHQTIIEYGGELRVKLEQDNQD